MGISTESLGKRSVMLVIATLAAILFLAGCDQKADKTNLVFTTEYQAVFMQNGQVFFGKLENMNSTYPVLKDVFYISQQVNPETKEVRQILIRRGNELHKPDQMYIQADHIAIIEPVAPDSQVAKLIREATAQKPVTGQ